MTTTHFPLRGLIAATYTPLHDDGSLNLAPVPAMVDHLLAAGVGGLYVCGSTGEGVSLTGDERRAVAEAYVTAADHRLPVIVQVGHNALTEARALAAHAESIGADAVSSNAPSYYPIAHLDTLIDAMAFVAGGAPSLPFYYYHIPVLTGVDFDMVELLAKAGDRIDMLAGIKFTASQLDTYQRCIEFDDGRFDIPWGCDEMLLPAMSVGARAAVGSTYNIAAPVYRRLINAFDRGDLAEARELQSWAITMIRTIARYPFHPAMKCVLAMLGHPVGPARLPLRNLTDAQRESLVRELRAIGFFDRVRIDPSASSPSQPQRDAQGTCT